MKHSDLFQKPALFIGLLIGLATPLPGQTAPEAEDEGFRISAGPGLIVSPRPYVGANAAIFPVPVVNVQYNRWYFEGIRGGFRFFEKGSLQANVFGQAQFKGLEPEDSDFLEGMETRRKSMDGGVEVVYRARPLGFRAAFLSDLLGRSKGQEFSLAAVSGFPLGKKVLILGAIGPRWLSENRADYYYGVRASEVRADRPAFAATSTWDIDIAISARIAVSPKWTFFALVNREGFGKGIEPSPILSRDSGYSVISFLTYSF